VLRHKDFLSSQDGTEEEEYGESSVEETRSRTDIWLACASGCNKKVVVFLVAPFLAYLIVRNAFSLTVTMHGIVAANVEESEKVRFCVIVFQPSEFSSCKHTSISVRARLNLQQPCTGQPCLHCFPPLAGWVYVDLGRCLTSVRK
jgi:hypothetical protein